MTSKTFQQRLIEQTGCDDTRAKELQGVAMRAAWIVGLHYNSFYNDFLALAVTDREPLLRGRDLLSLSEKPEDMNLLRQMAGDAGKDPNATAQDILTGLATFIGGLHITDRQLSRFIAADAFDEAMESLGGQISKDISGLKQSFGRAADSLRGFVKALNK